MTASSGNSGLETQGNVRYARRGRVALVTFDHPPVNAITRTMRVAFEGALDAARHDPEVAAVVLVGAGGVFGGGGELREANRTAESPRLVDLLDTLAALTKVTVAAIQGAALGQSLEIALACRFRVAASGSRLGLPEVKLGLIPGAGGAQRLPRLIGVAAALPILMEAREMDGARALSAGLIDALVDASGDDFIAAAIAFAERMLAEGSDALRARAAAVKPEDVALLEQAFLTAAKRQRGQPAPIEILAALRRSIDMPVGEAVGLDAEALERLLDTRASRALRRAFLIERAVLRPPSVATDTPVRRLQRAGVVGTGTMAVGVTAALLNAGLPVVVHGRSTDSLARAAAGVRQAIEPLVARGTVTRTEFEARFAAMTLTQDYAALAEVDLVIENVGEDLALKREVFAALGRSVRAGAILATNTSFLDLDAIAAATDRPQDVLALHFFNPAHVMRLLEIVRGRATAPDVLATALQLARRLGKMPVLVRACEGFVGNRMVSRRTREALFMIEEGATPWQVDRALVNFGFPLGPFAVNDLGGIDVVRATRIARAASLTPRERAFDLFDRLVAMGRLGRKSGAGWYRYDEQRQPLPDPAIEALIADYSARRGVVRRTIDDAEIVERCLLALVNEGARLITEGVVSRADEIDAVWLHGFALPAHLGGPMFQADELGLPRVLEALHRYSASVGPEYFTPAPLIETLAASGRSFYED